MFHSQITSSPHWSIRTWLNYLQKGGGLEIRFKYCVDPYSVDTILYFRVIKGHSGRKHIDPTLQDNVLLQSDFAEHIYYVPRSALDQKLRIDSGWHRSQEKEACCVLHGREPNVHRPLQRKGLRRDEAQDCSPKLSVLVLFEGCLE